MSSQVRCSQCNQLVPTSAGGGPTRCPTCNREVARPLFDDDFRMAGVAFGLCWVQGLAFLALGVGAVGLIVGGAAGVQRLLARQDGGAFPLTAALVNVQAVVLTAFFLWGPGRAAGTPADGDNNGPKN